MMFVAHRVCCSIDNSERVDTVDGDDNIESVDTVDGDNIIESVDIVDELMKD